MITLAKLALIIERTKKRIYNNDVLRHKFLCA